MSQPGESPNCYNCGQPLTGAFCGACGQKATALNQEVSDVLHEFAHETLHLDGKIVRSIAKVLVAPGALTRDHFEGRRVRWVSPIRLYLVFSVLYFAVAAFAPPGGIRVGVTKGDDVDGAERLREIGFNSVDELRDAISHAYLHWAPRAMFVLVPAFGWMVGVVLKKSGRNYPQHLYFALHVHAAWFAAAAVSALAKLTLPVSIAVAVSITAVIYSMVYFVRALMVAYDLGGRQATLRGAVVMSMYSVALIVVTMAIVIPVIFGPTGLKQILNQ